MKYLKIFTKIISWIVIIACLAVILGGIYTFYLREKKGVTCPTVFGVGSAVVISGSMEDVISVNDFVVTLAQDEYAVGDVVMYDAGEHPVTHRIVAEADGKFITKGDANNVEDKEPVEKSRIAGKVVAIIPGVGAVVDFMQSPLGIMLIILIEIAIIVMPSLFGKEEEK